METMPVLEQSYMLNTKIIYAESVENKSVDRDYRKHGIPRTSHLELFGGGISFSLRPGNKIHVLVIEDE